MIYLFLLPFDEKDLLTFLFCFIVVKRITSRIIIITTITPTRIHISVLWSLPPLFPPPLFPPCCLVHSSKDPENFKQFSQVSSPVLGSSIPIHSQEPLFNLAHALYSKQGFSFLFKHQFLSFIFLFFFTRTKKNLQKKCTKKNPSL